MIARAVFDCCSYPDGRLIVPSGDDVVSQVICVYHSSHQGYEVY